MPQEIVMHIQVVVKDKVKVKTKAHHLRIY
jgi:hypothetical protein